MPTSTEPVLSRLLDVVARIRGGEHAAIADADLASIPLTELGIDSLTLTMFIAAVEDEFEIEFDPEHLLPANFGTLDRVRMTTEAALGHGAAAHSAPTRASSTRGAPAAAATSQPVPAVALDPEDGWRDLPIEAQLLLCTARPRMSQGQADRARTILRSAEPRLDWGIFLDLAARHRVLALVARNFDRECLGPLGTVRRATLRGAYLYNRGRSDALVREWREMLRAFNDRGLRVVLRKGAYLSQHVYAEPALRYMEDLDLYVAAEYLPQFVETMRDLGYAQGSDSADRRRVEPLGRDVQVFWQLNVSSLPPFLRPTSEPYIDVFNVDVRRDLMEPASGKSVPAEDFLARAVKIVIGGEEALVPSDADMLLDIGVHLYREATTLSSIQAGKDICMVRFVDLMLWYARVRDRLDPDAVADLCDRYDLRQELYYSLHFTDVIFPGSIGANLLNRLRPADLAYLDEYGQIDGQPGTWTRPFLARLADRYRGAEVTGRSALIRPRREWTDDQHSMRVS